MRSFERRLARKGRASALLTLVGLLGMLLPLGGTSSAAASGAGVFWVHCDLASTTAYQVDPILDRMGTSGHNHIFFGNTNIPAAAAAGNFPGLTDAALEPTAPGNTKCSDVSDGTGEWFPELFYNGAQQPGIYTRTYYKSDGQNVPNPPGVNIPDKLQMINGFPRRTSPPAANDIGSVYWDCSSGGNASPFDSPHSPWPYSCSAWQQWVRSLGLTPPPDDGVVAVVDFPNCLMSSALKPGTGHNMDGGPLYDPASTTNDLEFGDGTMTGCPSGTVPIPFISERLHTLVDNPAQGATDDHLLVRKTSSWSGLPSCDSPDLSFTASGTRETAPCEVNDTPPQASDLLMGFASNADATGSTCGLPVASTCGYFTVHADYMQMWQQVDPIRLDSINGADPPDVDPQVSNDFAPTLEDAEEDCLWGAEARDCGKIGAETSPLPEGS